MGLTIEVAKQVFSEEREHGRMPVRQELDKTGY
jgi:hypothetical protein